MYDVIHVGAAAPEIPDAFFKQLRPGGRLILPGEYSNKVNITKIKKENLNFFSGTTWAIASLPTMG